MRFYYNKERVLNSSEYICDIEKKLLKLINSNNWKRVFQLKKIIGFMIKISNIFLLKRVIIKLISIKDYYMRFD